MKKVTAIASAVLILFFLIIYLSPGTFLSPLAGFLIADEPPEKADAVLVLNTGMGIYERLMEAADLYKQGYVSKVIINGNRKNEVLEKLEKMGLSHCCSWDEERIRVLELLGVPRTSITSISAPDVYDTVSEAQTIGPILTSKNIKKLIITTSKTHTARAIHIWRNLFGDHFSLISVAAKQDPFAPDTWWHTGSYIKQLLYEYGSWAFYFWKKIHHSDN